jgi:hypothetical protein
MSTIDSVKKNLSNLTKRVGTIQKHNRVIKKRTGTLGNDSVKLIGNALMGKIGGSLNLTAPSGGF